MRLYHHPVSVPCRAILLLLKFLNLKLDMIIIDMEADDHMTSEYLELNPQHTFPLLEDNGFVLSESRAILGYLADKYAPEIMLYPSDPMEKGVVNQRLFFDVGTLFQNTLECYLYPLMNGEDKMNEKANAKLMEALGFLNAFMGDANYMAGDKMTIADFSLMATISSLDAIGTDLSKFPKIMTWFKKCKMEMPGYEEANGKGAEMLGSMVKQAFALK